MAAASASSSTPSWPRSCACGSARPERAPGRRGAGPGNVCARERPNQAGTTGSPMIRKLISTTWLLAAAAVAHGAVTTPLLDAAYSGDTQQVASLLQAGAKPDEANDFGATPLGEAARRGDTAVLELLLKAGADVNHANAEGETALRRVARTGNVEAAKLLLKHGARVDTREQWGGQTALIWAAAQNHPPMIRLLAAKGADVNAHSAVRDWP